MVGCEELSEGVHALKHASATISSQAMLNLRTSEALRRLFLRSSDEWYSALPRQMVASPETTIAVHRPRRSCVTPPPPPHSSLAGAGGSGRRDTQYSLHVSGGEAAHGSDGPAAVHDSGKDGEEMSDDGGDTGGSGGREGSGGGTEKLEKDGKAAADASVADGQSAAVAGGGAAKESAASHAADNEDAAVGSTSPCAVTRGGVGPSGGSTPPTSDRQMAGAHTFQDVVGIEVPAPIAVPDLVC